MMKKIFKAVGFIAVTAAAVAGGLALYKKFMKSDEDFDDFDDFDDEDFDDDFSDLDIENRGYTTINSDDTSIDDEDVIDFDTTAEETEE